MNIAQIRLFLRIASTQNISLAGKELGLSPAVASNHMQKLEEHLGVRLIHRTTRKVSLTEEGVAFLPHAENVLSSVEMAEASLGLGQLKPKGVLRIAASASFGRMHLVPALADFMAHYPDLFVDLSLSDSMVDMVEGGFDIAIRDASLSDSAFIARKLAPVRRILCAAPAYLERVGYPEHPHDLKAHKTITLMGLEQWTFQGSDGLIPIKTSRSLRMDNGEAVRDACIAGLGITLNSTWCCYEAIQKGQLVEILSDYPLQQDASLWAVYPSSRMLAPKVRVFIDFLAERFGQNAVWD